MKHVLFQKGFRPFFLHGGLLGAGLILWWAFHYDAELTGEPGLEGIGWHSHVMIFGFTCAILAGFLYGGIIISLFKTQAGISWSGHFFGLLGGISAAFVYTPNPQSKTV